MKTMIMTSLIVTLAMTAAGCAKKSANRGSTNEVEGTSSGGGSFGDENSLRLLGWGKKVVANAIRQVNPQALEGFPQGWSQDRFAKLFENVKAEPNRVVYRYGRELMFDYKVPKTGEPYLIATSLYFRSHASVPLNSLWTTQREPYIREIRTKLLHEAAHVLGIGLSESSDYKARALAFMLINVLSVNNLVCKTNKVAENYQGLVSDETIESEIKKEFSDYPEGSLAEKVTAAKESPYYWVVNRPFGFGLQIRREPETKQSPITFGMHGSLAKLLNGEAGASYSTVGLYPLYKKGIDWSRQSIAPADLTREFTPPIIPGDDRVLQQYFKESRLEDGRWKIKGISKLDETCEYKETISIPITRKNNFTGRIEFSNTCPDKLGIQTDGEKMPAEISGMFPVDCVEAIRPISDMAQFFGEAPLKDKDLLEYEKTKDDLD